MINSNKYIIYYIDYLYYPHLDYYILKIFAGLHQVFVAIVNFKEFQARPFIQSVRVNCANSTAPSRIITTPYIRSLGRYYGIQNYSGGGVLVV